MDDGLADLGPGLHGFIPLRALLARKVDGHPIWDDYLIGLFLGEPDEWHEYAQKPGHYTMLFDKDRVLEVEKSQAFRDFREKLMHRRVGDRAYVQPAPRPRTSPVVVPSTEAERERDEDERLEAQFEQGVDRHRARERGKPKKRRRKGQVR